MFLQDSCYPTMKPGCYLSKDVIASASKPTVMKINRRKMNQWRKKGRVQNGATRSFVSGRHPQGKDMVC